MVVNLEHEVELNEDTMTEHPIDQINHSCK